MVYGIAKQLIDRVESMYFDCGLTVWAKPTEEVQRSIGRIQSTISSAERLITDQKNRVCTLGVV